MKPFCLKIFLCIAFSCLSVDYEYFVILITLGVIIKQFVSINLFSIVLTAERWGFEMDWIVQVIRENKILSGNSYFWKQIHHQIQSNVLLNHQYTQKYYKNIKQIEKKKMKNTYAHICESQQGPQAEKSIHISAVSVSRNLEHVTY